MLCCAYKALATGTVPTTKAEENFASYLALHLVQHGEWPKRPHLAPDVSSHRQISILKLSRR